MARDLDSRNHAWTDGVLAATVAGTALEESIPDVPEASVARRALSALLDSLRYEVDLDQLRDAWPQVRTDLRCYVLGIVREDAPENLDVLAGVLRACGIRPLHQPEPVVAAAGLRTIIRALLATRETDRARFELRAALAGVSARGATPLLGRYLLARMLAEREPLHGDEVARRPDAQAAALVHEPDPNRRLSYPTTLVGPALILLATLDVLEARASPDLPWRGQSAYNVLRVSSPEARWPEGLRTVMDAVLDGTVLADGELQRLVRGAIDAVREDMGAVASPMGGDGTETSKAPFAASPLEDSSPAASDGEDSVGTRVGRTPGDGDGTETSGARFRADHGEVSSPEPAAKQAPASQRPEDLAIAYLMRAIREEEAVPSLSECARAAGVTKQATANWTHFRRVWKNAKATRGGRIRRGYRSARTGDIEAEADDD